MTDTRNMASHEVQAAHAIYGLRNNALYRLCIAGLIAIVGYRVLVGKMDYALALIWIPFAIITAIKFYRLVSTVRLRGSKMERLNIFADGAGMMIGVTVLQGVVLAIVSLFIASQQQKELAKVSRPEIVAADQRKIAPDFCPQYFANKDMVGQEVIWAGAAWCEAFPQFNHGSAAKPDTPSATATTEAEPVNLWK